MSLRETPHDKAGRQHQSRIKTSRQTDHCTSSQMKQQTCSILSYWFPRSCLCLPSKAISIDGCSWLYKAQFTVNDEHGWSPLLTYTVSALASTSQIFMAWGLGVPAKLPGSWSSCAWQKSRSRVLSKGMASLADCAFMLHMATSDDVTASSLSLLPSMHAEN